MKLHICNFSGGKDSTAMLFKLLENNEPIDYIVFCDTGVEFPEIYNHIAKVDKILQKEYGKHITYLRADYNFIEYMTIYKRKRGKWKDLPYFFPSPKHRWCTGMLKLNPLRKFKRQFSRETTFIDYVGYSIDELKRAKNKLNKETSNQRYIFPLIDYNYTSKDALTFCYDLGFNWNNLYQYTSRASCYTCPFSSKRELTYIINYRSKLWNVVKFLEQHLKNLGIKEWKFTPTLSALELEEKFKIL